MSATPSTFQPRSRHLEGRLRDALADTRIVALVGPRQSGKTTLARKIVADSGMSYVTLDDQQTREFARDDPNGFVRGLGSAVIDEVQRAPSLVLALKLAVDEDPSPGRFLITGSVDLFRITASPDSLAGRVETLELLPFSQAELEARPPSRFLERAFAGDFPALELTGRTADLIDRVVAGGYPEAVARVTPARRRAWLIEYARALGRRDIVEIASVSKLEELSRLIEYAAVASGQLLNATALAAPLGVDAKTADRWIGLLEQLFVVRRVRAWHRNDLKRLVKSPKLHFVDSGLLTALRHVTAADLGTNRTKLGSLLECFVHSELLKIIALMPSLPTISHYRDKDQNEVDFVIEHELAVVGVEVKASATVNRDDLTGLQRLREAAGSAFACGIVLYDGDRIQRAGDRLFAVPFRELWV
jgi:predicted AAA+ superfamily ATPase